MDYVLSPTSLKILARNGRPLNEYRIISESVEFRALGPGKHPSALGDWRQLTADDIALHTNLGTLVAKWLKLRPRIQRGRAI